MRKEKNHKVIFNTEVALLNYEKLTLFKDKLFEPINVVLNSLPIFTRFAGDWVGDGLTTIPVPAGLIWFAESLL